MKELGYVLIFLAVLAGFFGILYAILAKLRELRSLAGGEAAAEAMTEAKSAHHRLDRIDQEMKDDRREIGVVRAMVNVVKGRLTFLMHKDISDEIRQQADREENHGSDPDPPHS